MPVEVTPCLAAGTDLPPRIRWRTLAKKPISVMADYIIDRWPSSFNLGS